LVFRHQPKLSTTIDEGKNFIFLESQVMLGFTCDCGA